MVMGDNSNDMFFPFYVLSNLENLLNYQHILRISHVDWRGVAVTGQIMPIKFIVYVKIYWGDSSTIVA
ncbi:hypothetical protein SALWKB12_0269 [Snodgrassella communis]|jgi:hypothetical protein|nr:hypothetical protein SALWKB12_0269 [Snodgrassella communis]